MSFPLTQATLAFMWLFTTFSCRQLFVTVTPLLTATKSHCDSFRPARTHSTLCLVCWSSPWWHQNSIIRGGTPYKHKTHPGTCQGRQICQGNSSSADALVQFTETRCRISAVQRHKVWYISRCVCIVDRDLLQVAKVKELIVASRVGKIQMSQAQEKQHNQSWKDRWSVPVKPTAPQYDMWQTDMRWQQPANDAWADHEGEHYALTHSLIHSLDRSLTHSLIHSLIHPFIHPSIHLSDNVSSPRVRYVQSWVDPCMRSCSGTCMHVYTRWYIHEHTCMHFAQSMPHAV